MKSVETYPQRKAGLLKNASAIISFPGGIGTMDEWFETLALKQAGFLSVPIVLFNLEKFYDPILAWLREAEKKKINIVLVKEQIDLSTTAGRFQAHMLMVCYQFQKEIQLENAREGRRHAESKKDFKGWGKPSSLSDKRVKAIRKARHEKNRTLKDIAEEYGISVSYVHRLTNDEKRKQYNEAHKARQREKYAEAN